MQQSYGGFFYKNKLLRLNILSVFAFVWVRIFKYTRKCFTHFTRPNKLFLKNDLLKVLMVTGNLVLCCA